MLEEMQEYKRQNYFYLKADLTNPSLKVNYKCCIFML